MDVEALNERVKNVIIDGLQLREMGIDTIDDDAPLFGDSGLGLDSVDALELVLEVERQFGVTIDDSEEGRKVLRSVATLAAHIQAQQGTAL